MFYIYLFLDLCERGILGLYFVGRNAGKFKLYTGLHERKLFVYAVFI